MAFKSTGLAPCPNGHANAQWENQGGWYRCYCPPCHAIAHQAGIRHKKWLRQIRSSKVRIKDALAQQVPLEHNDNQDHLAQDS